MSDATRAIAALKTALAAVAPVLTGRAALETTSAVLPVITLWSTADAPATEQGYDVLQYTRSVTVEYKAVASSGFNDDLDTALSAIRRALKTKLGDGSPLSGYATALRQNTATFFAPADNGAIAVVQINLEFDYLERFN